MEKLSKRLLIVGAGREQIPAYELAKQKGYFVVGTDQDKNAPAFEFADDQLICSTRDAEETLRVVLDYTEKNKVDGVMTIANDVPLTVAKVASVLKLPSIPVESAEFASNKILMKEKFEKAKVVTPLYDVVKTKKAFLEAVSKRSFPLVLKPSDGRGARGVLYLDESIDLGWAWEASLQESENKVLILEEFIPGPQLSVEGLFVDKKYVPIAFADRNYENLLETKPFIVENGGIIPSHFEGALLEEVGLLIENGAKALGIDWGPVKADIVVSETGPQIIELAARLSGNYLATHHIPMAYGVDIVGAEIELALGNKVDTEMLQPKFKHYLGVRYFFPSEGKVKAIKGVDEVESLEWLRFLLLNRKVGDVQSKIDCHGNRAGTIICEGPDYQEAKKRVEEAASKIEFLTG